MEVLAPQNNYMIWITLAVIFFLFTTLAIPLAIFYGSRF